MRRPIVVGNWKMHNTLGQANDLACAIRSLLGADPTTEVVLCPPFSALQVVAEVLAGSAIQLGAQNVHEEPQGAFTGEISVAMLQDLGCHHVIVGHSERRALFGETDARVNAKTRAVLRSGLTPIVCVGETLEQRESDRTEAVLQQQVTQSLTELGDDLLRVIVAYEPVWAIGTGRTASAEQAQQAHAFIRRILEGISRREIAQKIRIQYGGSVKPSNAVELFSRPDVDGGLIGGAALDPRSFVAIVQAAGSDVVPGSG